jgi:hypothetical protein
MRQTLPLLLLCTLCGCGSADPRPIDPDRLLHMAGEEAGQITAPKDRLTRQLNIADRENDAGRRDAARNTLRAARETLERADPSALDDHARLAGWVSLCELARAVEDKPFANAALDQALAALGGITPHQARCPYVPGVEQELRELRELRGNAPAIKLLTDAAQWALEIPEPMTRRGTFVGYAEELFRCNDYDAARNVLRLDPDPAWRSDSLVALADRARRNQEFSFSPIVGYAAKASLADEVSGVTSGSPGAGQPVFKALDFKSNYYRR